MLILAEKKWEPIRGSHLL